MLNFLTANNIMDMAGLDEKFSSMIGVQMDIRDKLKPIEQTDIYIRYKGKKALSESEQIEKAFKYLAAGTAEPRKAQDMEH